jgi:MFS family permease
MPARAYPWYLAVLLSLANAIAMLDRFVMGLVMVPIKNDLGLSDSQLGLLFGTAFAVLFVIAGVPLGRLADLRNRRNVIAGGLLVWCIATAASGLATSFAGLFAARLTVGIGEAALTPAAMSLLAAYFHRAQLARSTAIFTLGAPLGRAAAFLGFGIAFSALASRGGLRLPGFGNLAPWQGTFILACVPGLVLLPLLFTIREPTRGRGAEAPTSTALTAAFTHLRHNLRAYLTHTGAFSAAATIQWALTGWGTSFFVRQHHLSIAMAGSIIGIAGLTAPLGHLLGGFAMDRLATRGVLQPARPVIAACLTLGIVPACLLAFAPNVSIAIAAFVLLQLIMSCAGPPGYAGVQLLTPEAYRGVMTSMFVATFTLVSLGAGPLIVGIFSDHLFAGLGLGLSLLATIALCTLSGLACVLAAQSLTKAQGHAKGGAAP